LAGSVIAVADGGAAFAVGVLAVPLALLVCVALARAVTAANVRLLSSRRGRDLAVLSGLLIAVGAQVVNFGAQRLRSSGLAARDPVAQVLGGLPPASAPAALHATGEGSDAGAAARVALTAAALAVRLARWTRSLTGLVAAPAGSTAPASGPAARDRASGGLTR